ncbi:MAG: DUF4912 domain-containing protein [Treponema sp.]|nr:DUF4912 domain-containing protein [Treponema sp.]
MEKQVINRAYLETLSFTDLISLADKYGIDVPDNLNRSFLIGDLLDMAEEMKKMSASDMVVSSASGAVPEENKLPDTYNVTDIEAVLRNPAWAFVYWNISENELHSMKKAGAPALALRVCSFADKNDIKPDDVYDVQITFADREQYILLPAGKQYVRIELVFTNKGICRVLAASNLIEIPHGTKLLADMKPGKEERLAPVLELSGMKKLLVDQYKNHRQSFS